MYEHLASLFGGPPNSYHFNLYSEWAKHQWGMIVTGNVEVSADHLSLGRDITIPEHITDENLVPFKKLSAAIHGLYISSQGTISGNSNKTLAIMQLNHPGRQSSNFIGGRGLFKPPLAPSAVRVGGRQLGLMSSAIHALMFQTPKPMTHVDITEMIQAFVKGAKVAYLSGFDGIQLHIAHGCKLLYHLSVIQHADLLVGPRSFGTVPFTQGRPPHENK
jgi:2,4-dienoyl-CoA reductase-like NADH-dependent reductase (Old Yellow Enzyme family)